MINTIFHALLMGTVLGIFYGLSFVMQQRRVFYSKTPSRKHMMVPFIVRIMILIGFGYYLLHSPSHLFILVVIVSFLLAFWLVILSKKAFYHEWT